MKVLNQNEKFKEVKGNLITLAKKGEFDIIVHGCNCFATMGAGIARAIAANFPQAYRADKSWRTKTNAERLGKFTEAVIPLGESDNAKKLVVINGYTQYAPGADFRMSALKECLEGIKDKYADLPSEPKPNIGFPMIGCGIGGGNWEMVRPVIVDALSDSFNITFVYLEE